MLEVDLNVRAAVDPDLIEPALAEVVQWSTARDAIELGLQGAGLRIDVDGLRLIPGSSAEAGEPKPDGLDWARTPRVRAALVAHGDAEALALFDRKTRG